MIWGWGEGGKERSYPNFSVQLKLFLNTIDDGYSFDHSPTQFVVAPNSELFLGGGGEERAGYIMKI